MARSLFTVSLTAATSLLALSPSLSLSFITLTLTLQQLRHNENTQAVPGGETVEGECVNSVSLSLGHAHVLCSHLISLCHVRHVGVSLLSNYASNQCVSEHLKGIFKRNYKLFLGLRRCQRHLFIYLLSFQSV